MGRGTRAKQPSTLSTSAPKRIHFRGTRVLPMCFLPLCYSTWLFRARQWNLLVYHFCIISLTNTGYASPCRVHTKWRRTGRWEKMKKDWEVGNKDTRSVTGTEAVWGQQVLTRPCFSIAGVIVTCFLCSQYRKMHFQRAESESNQALSLSMCGWLWRKSILSSYA